MRNSYSKTLLAFIVLLVGCAEAATDSSPVWVDPAVEQQLERGELVTAVIEVEDSSRWPAALVVERDFTHVSQRVATLDSTAALDELVASGSVRAVFEDIELRTTGIAEGFDYIGQPDAVGRGYTGAGRSVAILDTGVDWTREVFGDCTAPGSEGCRVLAARDFAPDDGVLDEGWFHGTNVAGITALTAPDAGILALDVFDGERAKSSDIIAAVNWVIANRETYDTAAINMSLGTDSTFGTACDTSVFAAPIAAALENGIATVVSSGNGAESDAVSSPGCVSDAVTVGAIHGAPTASLRTSVCEQLDAEQGDVACFSNSSDQIDLLAPGVGVDAAGIRMSGTSQAAPHVSGAMAMIAAMMDRSDGPLEWTATLRTTGLNTVDYRNDESYMTIGLDGATEEDLPAEEPSEEEPSEEPPTEEEPDEDPSEEEPAEEEPPAEEPPAEEPPAEEPPAEEPVPDEPEPPTAEGIGVTINGGDDVTQSRTVTLTLEDDQATRVCVSNGSTCTAWQDFVGALEWELEPGTGSREVTVWFARSGGSFLSAERASDTIYVAE